MARKSDLGEFVFDLYITGAGPYWGDPFRMAAEQVFGSPGLSDLSAAARGWSIAAGMVRSGLYLCERHDPGFYHDFLMALLVAVLEEKDIILERGYIGEVWKVPWHVLPLENEMMHMAEGILDRRIVNEPRAVAFALIREGLRFCEDFAPERYPGFVSKVSAFMLDETDRVKGGPRRILPRVAPTPQTELQILTATFNIAAARAPASA